MKRIITISIICLSIACGEHAHHDGTESHHDQHHEEHHEGHPKVTLDDGKKWQVNPETSTHILNMGPILEQALENENVDYQLIGSKLDKEFKLIFTECTMEGEAHEQLHNYMIPLHRLIQSLLNAESDDPAATVHEILEYLGEFDAYFVL